MADTLKTARWQRSVMMLTHVVMMVVALVALYFLRDVFVPLALAIFFSFLLYPFFKALQRRGVPRKLAVVSVVVSSLLVFGGGCWVISAQLSNLASELPDYSRNITKKLTSLKEMTGGSGRWKNFTQEISNVVNGKAPRSGVEVTIPGKNETKDLAMLQWSIFQVFKEGMLPGKNEPQEPARVVVQGDTPPWVVWVSSHASSALGFVAELALSLVLVLFILLNREDLLNRVLRLAGQQRASLTSKAVGETGKRVSRFLVVQFMVNSTFGILLTVCLFILGVNYALLWGFLTAILRYIPYIGPWVAALFPLTMSLAQFDGWWQLLVILGVYLTLELVISNVVEPYLYGQSIGVSEVALLLSAAFWAWMWGPVGLVLSAPLTVVIVVLGKYVHELHYLTVLFGDEPALSKDMTLYQRLLSQDHDEMERLLVARLEEPASEKLYDELLLPSLYHLKADQRRRVVDSDEVKEVQATMQELLEDLLLPVSSTVVGPVAIQDEPKPVAVLGFAVRDMNDYLSMMMLSKLLDPVKWNYQLAPANSLSSEILEKLKQDQIQAICLGMIPPGSSVHLRYLCKKIRMQFPDIKILVGLWGPEPVSENKIKALNEAGADWVGNSLEEAETTLSVWYPVWSEQIERQVA